MTSQTPRSQLSPEARNKAARIYWMTNWFLRLIVAAVVLVSWWIIPNIPEIATNLAFIAGLALAIWVGNYCASIRLERLGIQSRAKEIRTLTARVKPKFAVDLAAPRFFVKHKIILNFAAILLLLFGILGWIGRGFGSWHDAQTCALAALMIAIASFVIVGYLFPQSQIIQSLKRSLNNTWGTSDSDYVKVVAQWGLQRCHSERREARTKSKNP